MLVFSSPSSRVIPGSRVSLFVDVGLPPDTHVYAPGVTGYKPIALIVQPSGEIEVAAAGYPEAKTLCLDAINEKVAVFEGKFRIVQDVKITVSEALVESLGATGRTVRVAAELRYQACDQTICYRPTSVPVSWQLQVLPLDTQRSPESIRHKE
jgi:cytochrome c biogenesis DsbD-like protein